MSAERKNAGYHISHPCNNPEETYGHFHDQVYLGYFPGNPEHLIQVLPLNDENKPKCYLCHEIFENMVDLKKHQESRHKEFFEKYEKYDTEN